MKNIARVITSNSNLCEPLCECVVKEELPEYVVKSVSPNISPVISAYEHAILACCPRPRYVLGLRAQLIFRPLTWLPEWLADWVLARVGYHKPQLAALQQ